MVLGLLNTSDTATSGGGLSSPSQQPARIEVGETEAEGQRCTLVKIAASTPVSFRDITPVFEDLGINIVSFGTDRQLGGALQQNQKKHLQAFKGSFLVTDDDGDCLQDDLIKALVAALQRVLHVSFTTSALRKSDSVGSNLSNASTAPDTPGGAPLSSSARDAMLQSTEARLQYNNNPARAQLDSSNSSTPTANSSGSRFTASARGGSCEVVLSMQLPQSHDSKRRATSEQGDEPSSENSAMLLDCAPGDLTAAQLLTNRQPATLGGLSAGSLQQHEQCHAAPASTTSVASVATTPGRGMSVSRQPSNSSVGTASQDMSETGHMQLPQHHSPTVHQSATSPVEAVSALLGLPPAVMGPALSLASTDASQQLGTLTVSSSGFTDRAASLTRQLSLREDDVLELAAGQQTVDSIMNSPVQNVHMNADLVTAKALMSQYQISALLVDTGTPTPGFITKRDFLKVSFSKTLKNARVKDVMTQPAICIHSGASLREAVQLIAVKGVRRILVYDASRESPTNFLAPYTGLLSDTDIFRVLGSSRARQEEVVAEQAQAAVQIQEQEQQVAGGSQQRTSPGRTQQLQPHQSTGSTISMNSLAMSISSISEQAKHFSTEERYRAAAALWELEFSEIEVIRRIGEGSFGEVMLANFRGTKVAVKRMRGFELPSVDDGPGPSPTMMPVFAQFFEREIEIMATIRHPNVVTFIGACHTPPNVCLVTEYCARGSLDHLLHKSGLHLDLTKKVEFAMDIARGMSCLHAQRPAIIHRDLKTANLLVSARFEVKVSDFGLSRIKDHAQLINSRAGLEGTVEYCAPEVLRGEPYTEKCDVWSFGVVLWELMNRQRPYADADVPVYILMMALGAGSLRLPALREEVSTPGLVRLVERCFAWQPADRPSFREVLHALENEYKVVRGKAAAVPRSDSASSMVVLGQHAQHGESADVTLLPPGHSSQPAPAGPSRPTAATPPVAPASVAHALGTGTAPRAPACVRVPVPSPPFLRQPRSPGRSGDGATDPTERHSGHTPTSRFAPAHSGSLAAGADGHGGNTVLRSSNSQSGTGHAPSRAAAGPAAGSSQMAHMGSGGKGRPPRPRRLSRARSTPLPEHIWFQEPASYEDEEEEGGDMQPQHLSMAGDGTQRSVDAHGVSSSIPYPLSRLTNIPEMASLSESQGYESGSSVSSPKTARSSGAAAVSVHAEKPSSSLRAWSAASADDAAVETSLQQGMPAAPAGVNTPPTLQASASQTAAPHVHVWSSPFDGFLPFSEEDPQSPDTPKMQSAVNAADVDAAIIPAAGGSAPASADLATLDGAVIQLAAALVASSSSLASDAAPAGPPRTTRFHSPFSAFSQLPHDSGDGQHLPQPHDVQSAVAGVAGPVPVQQAQAPTGARTGNFFSPFADLPSFDDMPAEDGPQPEAGSATASGDAISEQTVTDAAGSAQTAGRYLCEFDTSLANLEGSGFLEGSSQPPAAGEEPSSFLDITMSGLVQPHLSMLGPLSHAPETLGSESPSPPATGGAPTTQTSTSAALHAGRGDSGVLTHSVHSDNTAPLNLATSMSMCLSMDSPANPEALAANLQAAGLQAHVLPQVLLARASAGSRPTRSEQSGMLMRVSPVAAGKHSKEWDGPGAQPGSPAVSGRRSLDVRAMLPGGGSNGGTDPGSKQASTSAGGAATGLHQQQQPAGKDDDEEALTVHQVAWVKV